MSKQSVINIIGKLYVDENFRDKFYNDNEETLKKTTGLTIKEKNFLKKYKNDIRRSVDKLNIKYDAGNKSR